MNTFNISYLHLWKTSFEWEKAYELSLQNASKMCMLTCTTDINRQKYKNNTCILELKKGDCKTKKK